MYWEKIFKNSLIFRPFKVEYPLKKKKNKNKLLLKCTKKEK